MIAGQPIASTPIAGKRTSQNGISGSVSTSQAQTVAGTGTVANPAITGIAATSQAQTVAATGTFTPALVTGTAATSQAQTISATGSYTPALVTGTAATSQAQTTAATGTFIALVTGSASTSQAQTTAGEGQFNSGVAGSATTSQAQTAQGSGAITDPVYVEPPNEVQIKRWYVRKNGRVYIFNSAQEADAFVAADKAASDAIAKAQATSKAAKKKIRRKIYDATGVEPESVSIDHVTGLVSLYGLQFDVPSLIAQSDFETFMQVALMAQAIEEEEIEMLLMA